MSNKVRLNPQGLSRKYAPLMSCILPDEGNITCSVDLSAGEPSVTAHYSRDKNYFAANFGMVGKKPYYDEKSILQISDMYFMGASVSPTGRDTMKEAFHTTWRGVPFAELWLEDEEFLKNELGGIRKPHKQQILAMQYGQTPTGMVKSAYENGTLLTRKDAKTFHRQFWYDLFPDVRKLGEVLQVKFRRQGFLVNEFGYRLVPDKERKCLNYWIQSSVSGIIKVLTVKFFMSCPYVVYDLCVHDELVFQLPIDKVDEVREYFNKTVESLNADLNWSVKIRCGWVTGKNWMEAK